MSASGRQSRFSPPAMSTAWRPCWQPTRSWPRPGRSDLTRRSCSVWCSAMPPVETLESLVELLAAHGAELTGPLIAASGVNNLRAIRKLLDLGARIDGDGEGGWSPLEEALYWGNEAAVDLLLERGAAAGNLRTFAALGDMEAVAHCFDETGALTEAAGEVAWPFGGEIPEGRPPRSRADRRQRAGLRRGMGQDRRRASTSSSVAHESTRSPPVSISRGLRCITPRSAAAGRWSTTCSPTAPTPPSPTRRSASCRKTGPSTTATTSSRLISSAAPAGGLIGRPSRSRIRLLQ